MFSILVTNPKGGSGKTTIATHLAGAFATAGRRCLLADVDRQGSSLNWLKRRPGSAAPIEALDWRKGLRRAPKGKGMLIIDAPAAIRSKATDELVGQADAIVVPVLPSAFDQESTAAFLDRLDELKPIRKNKKPVALVRNRVRRNSRAAARLDLFMVGIDRRDAGRLSDRAVYPEVAGRGLTIFDLTGARIAELHQDWLPLLRFLDEAA